MRKPISPKVHGAIDYATSAATAAAPHMFDFPDRARHLAHGLAGGYGALSMLTDYEMGVKKVVPFKGHGLAEAAIGMVLPALPWLMGFAKNRSARNFYLGMTALTFAVAALTDWEAGEEKTSPKRSRSQANGQGARKRSSTSSPRKRSAKRASA